MESSINIKTKEAMDLNNLFGDVKSQLDDLTNEAKKIDDRKHLEQRKRMLNYLENDYEHLKPY
mgnify:CR=1 FL=1